MSRFKVDDEVYCDFIKEVGTIIEIDSNCEWRGTPMPIVVKFEHGRISTYTENGKYTKTSEYSIRLLTKLERVLK